jgi:hypothetical protein
MSHENLSRRAILAGAASVPALALPAIAVAAPTVAMPRTASGPTAIDLLWKQRQATKREYATARKRHTRLMAEFKRLMPKPHPSIVYSAENDADGLQFYMPDREPFTLNCYIWSSDIEREIEKIEQSCAGYERVGHEWILYPDKKHPISEQDIARRDRLIARLELSRQYEKKKDKIYRELGLKKLDRKIEDQLLPRLSKIETRIYSARAATQADLYRKLAVYDSDDNSEFVAERLRYDFRRLVKSTPLSTAARETVQS